MMHWRRPAVIAVAAALATSLVGAAGALPVFAATTYGNTVQFTTSPNPPVVPANGTSTIVLSFSAYATTSDNVTITTTAGTFTATSASSGIVVNSSNPTMATVTNPTDLAAGATLTITSPTTPVVGMLDIWLTPVAGGAATLDSSTPITFTSAAPTIYGSAVQFTTSPNPPVVPANGTSTIVLTFPSGYATTSNNVMFTLSAGTFTATSAGSGIVINNSTQATLTNPTDLAAGSTLTITSPTSPTVGTLTVSLTPVAGGAAVVDSSTTLTFTGAVATQPTPGQEYEHGHGHGANVVPFYSSPNYTCSAGAQPAAGTLPDGFAVLNTTGNAMLNVEVVLRGAMPNSTYSLWVNQNPGACPLSSATAPDAITTNAEGNGAAHLRVSLVSGATGFWVSATSGSSVLRTPAAMLHLKGDHGDHGDQGVGFAFGRGHGHRGGED